jgi:hypothetical protein
MGTPRARPTRAVNPSSTGTVARPSGCGEDTRWDCAPDRETRPRPCNHRSLPTTITLRATSTRASAQAVGRSNPTWNSVKISVVNVRYPTISNAPYSASRTRLTSSAPPRIAPRACPIVTRQNVRTGPTPRLREVSSCDGSA